MGIVVKMSTYSIVYLLLCFCNSYKEDMSLEFSMQLPEEQVKLCIMKSIAKLCNEYNYIMYP